MASFGHRLHSAFERYGHLCVGIDPHPWLLAEWGLAASATGARDFGLRVVEAAAGRVGIIKPQVAFFERFGSAGYAALEDVITAARAAELLVIADAKRGDVGSTIEGYSEAWLSPGSPLEADAMTASAYQGVGSLTAAFDLADQHDKGVFVLCATSNPEAAALQRARLDDGTTVAESIAAAVAVRGERQADSPFASAGLVVGATVNAADFDIDLASLHRTPILAPGFGHQGARFDELTARYGSASHSVLATVSRSVLSAGAAGVAPAIEAQARELAACLA